MLGWFKRVEWDAVAGILAAVAANQIAQDFERAPHRRRPRAESHGDPVDGVL